METIKQKTKKAIPYSVALSLLRFVLSLFGMVLLVRYLESEQYGVLVLFMGLAGLINLFFSFGHDQFIRRFIPAKENKNEINKLFYSILIRKVGLATVVSLLLLVCFNFYSEKFGISQYFKSFLIYQLAVISQVGTKYFIRVFNALFMQKFELIVDAVFQVLKIVAINIGIIFGLDFHFFVLSFTIIRLLRTAIEIILFSTKYGFARLDKEVFRFHEDSEQKKYRRTSYVLGFGTTFLSTNIDQYILAFSSNNVQVAVYAIATSLLKKIQFFIPSKMLDPVIEPAFYSKYDKSKSQDELNKMFQFICITGSVISFFFISILIPLGKEILTFLFKRDYVGEAYWPLLIFIGYILVFSIPLGLAAKAIMKPEIILVAQISGVVNIVLGFILAARYGAMGMAIATTTSVLLRQAVLFISLRRKVAISMPWNQLVRLTISSSIVAFLIFQLKAVTDFHFIILGLIGMVTYVLFTLKVISVFTEEQKKIILSLLPKKVLPGATLLFAK